MSIWTRCWPIPAVRPCCPGSCNVPVPRCIARCGGAATTELWSGSAAASTHAIRHASLRSSPRFSPSWDSGPVAPGRHQPELQVRRQSVARRPPLPAPAGEARRGGSVRVAVWQAVRHRRYHADADARAAVAGGDGPSLCLLRPLSLPRPDREGPDRAEGAAGLGGLPPPRRHAAAGRRHVPCALSRPAAALLRGPQHPGHPERGTRARAGAAPHRGLSRGFGGHVHRALPFLETTRKGRLRKRDGRFESHISATAVGGRTAR